MDEPDIPMLDVGDFEVLDECVGEDDNEDDQGRRSSDDEEEDDDDRHDNPKRKRESQRLREREDANMDENSGDNADNILDVSIDVAENEFLESVAKDFSENIEEDIEERPRPRTRSRRGEPMVQIKRLAPNSKKQEEPEVVEVVQPRKKPGPKSKTMNVQTPTPKRPIKKINYSDKPEKDENTTENQKNSNAESQKTESTGSQKNTNAATQKNKETKTEQGVQNKTPAFLKKDLTDEEIMIHFDEIENTVLTSESFVIQNDVEQTEAEEGEKNASIRNEDNKDESNQNEDKKNENEEEENWDNSEVPVKKPPKIKIEEREFKESEMWYKEKIKGKENIVEEKFTKLAKIIQYSYPMYKKWLDRNESLFGTAICKVEPSKHSPLDQLHPNRWKFICNKKHNQESSKAEDKQADNTSDNKNVQSSWQMIPGVPDANLENTEEYPPFVMRVVKVFEEFLQSLEKSSNNETENTKEENESENRVKNSEDASEDNQETSTTAKSKTDNEKANENDKSFIKNLDGLTVLIRSNRKEDLMMHITGKNISGELMEKIKDLFENGPGKDCNVKSLYCKTIIKENNVIKTNNTLLLGSETLDDNIGPVKVQLAQKTNVWSNLAGVEVLANAVAEYLVPTKKTTVIEIGCGTGLISLLLASKCQKVIGVDVQKEIVEAQLTCELNEIKNVVFITGKPKVVITEIDKSLNDAKAVAVINTNNVFGKCFEVIASLRKISTLGRIVVITTLTKQSIRSILELTQPADDVYGNPFIPIKACIVDTSPKSFGFDIVMSMERRTMRNLLKVSPAEGATTNPVGLISKSKQIAALKYNAGITPAPNDKAFLKFVRGFKPPHKTGFITKKKFFANPNFNPKFQGKRPYPGSDPTMYHPGAKKFKQFDKPWLGPNIRPNPLHEKKMRDADQGDLRERLSSNRVEPTAIAQEVQEQKKILDAAKEKLTGVGSSVDNDTVKKLAEMLNLAIEKTNKLQSQLPPRSVWDRIAPPDSSMDEDQLKSGPPMKGRLVKETGPKEIIITTSNSREYNAPPAGPPKSKKYDNIPPLEPNLIMPVGKATRLKMTQSVQQKPSSAPYQKPGPNRFQGGNYRKPENQAPWNRNKQQSYGEPQEKWVRSSPPRQMRSPPRQSSPPHRPVSPARHPVSPPRRPVSPPRRPVSPSFRQHSSSSRNMSGSGRQNSPSRRHNSPPRRPASPHYRSPPRQSMPSRQKSPPRRYADEWDIPSRGAIVESGWNRPEKEKTGWSSGPPTSSSSNWNQSSSTNKYRADDKWDNPGAGSWSNKNQSPPQQSSSNNRWKAPNNPVSTNWDVQRKNPPVRETGRHEPRNEPRHEPRNESRHEPRHESRREPRWEPPEKSFRNEKDDWNDLPEDARDPWGDDHPTTTKPEMRWNNQSREPNQPSGWSRDKPNDNWLNKQNFPLNNMGGNNGPVGGGGAGGGMNSNMNMGMGMGMGMNKSVWQAQPQQQPNRNPNWMPSGNWQGGGGGGGAPAPGVGLGSLLLGNALNNWQPPQQNFSNFQSRPFNNNPQFMNNRR